jgi:hypothetical protein
MLILPIGLEKNEVRRIPWVSVALIVSCVLVHIVLSTSFADDERETSRALGQAFEYLGAHRCWGTRAWPSSRRCVRNGARAGLRSHRPWPSSSRMSSTS